MQIFANGKRRFYSFMEFYVIHLKNQRVQFDHSSTLKYFQVAGVQVSSSQLVIENFNTSFQQDLKTDVHIKGVFMTKACSLN